MPIPIFAPVVMLPDGVSEGVGTGVTVDEATFEVVDGAAVIVVGFRLVVDDPMSCRTWVSVLCHPIWITSAKMVFCATSAARKVVSRTLVGNGPACSEEVEKTLVKSVVKTVAQKLRSFPDELEDNL